MRLLYQIFYRLSHMVFVIEERHALSEPYISEFHLLDFIFTEMLIEIDGNLFLIGSDTPRLAGDWGRGLPHVNTSYCFRKSAFR